MEVGLRPEAAPRKADPHRDGASLGRRGFSSACRAIPAQSWNASALSTSVDKHQRGLLVQRQPTRFLHADGHARAAVGVQNEAGVVARRVIAAVDSDAGRVDRE